MTPEALEDLVLGETDSWALRRAFADLDEKARAKLSPAIQKLYRQLNACKANDDASVRLKALLAPRGKESWKFYNSRENRSAALALFAVGTLSAVKKRVYIWGEDEVLEAILADRRPDWIDDWIAHELGQDFTPLSFATIRGWVKAGVCRKPTVDGYYRQLAAYLMRTHTPGKREEHAPPISRQLLDDPDLLEDVPALFAVETIAFNTNSWLKVGAGPDYETWPEALVKLSSQGRLDRAGLLRAALAGLVLDNKENQLSGLHRFYAQMAPTREELLRDQDAYIDLLSHPVGHVAKFALDMLAKVEKEGVLHTAPVLREVQAVFAAEGKGNAVAGLKLVQRVAARSKGAQQQAALSAAVEGLRHANADVQAKALDLLVANARQLTAEQLARAGEIEAFVAASNRGRLKALVGEAAVMPAAWEAGGDAAPGLSEAPADGEAYASPPGGIDPHSVLASQATLAPIASVDALIDALLHAVERVDAPDEVERIVDAISRLAGDRPADLGRRVEPLLHRLENGRTGASGLGTTRFGVGLAVLDLVYSWATGKLYRTKDGNTEYSSREDAFAPVITHLRAVTERVARRESQLLLCAPTHQGGWIDPTVWVERLRALDQVPMVEHSMDFRLSLLRLAPDGRAEAMARAGLLSGGVRRIAVFALGGEEGPTRDDRRAAAAWITAARCRDALADWSPAFAALTLDDAWPDSLRPAEYSWRTSHIPGRHEQMRWKTPQFHLSITCRGGMRAEPPRGFLTRLLGSASKGLVTNWSDIPSAAICRRAEAKRYYWGDLNTSWVTQWLGQLWPQNPAAAQMKAAAKLAERIDGDSSGWTPGHGFMQSLFQKNRPWREAGHLLLCMGLIGKDADVKGLAVDALIEGVDVRLFDPEMFAEVMARLCEGQWVKFNRLGDGLLLAAQASGRHAAAVSLALQAWLPRFDFQARGAASILEVLVETKAITGRGLQEPAAAALRSITGSSKTAKLAKALLSAA